MPLHDHHRPPLSDIAQWTAFHSRWANVLVSDLAPMLPPQYYAEPMVRFKIEVDAALFERLRDAARQSGGPAWTSAGWTPPPPAVVAPFTVDTDENEARVYQRGSDGLQLVGAIELVSPANKDRADTRAAFVTKCERFLQQGVGVVVVDTVTTCHASLHNELMDRVGCPDGRRDDHIYVAAYRATGAAGVGELQAWTYPLAVGGALPTAPLWLRGGVCLPARLNDTYERCFRESRLAERLAPLPVADTA